MPLDFPSPPQKDQFYKGWLSEYGFWGFAGAAVGTVRIIPEGFGQGEDFGQGSGEATTTSTTTTTTSTTTTTTLEPTTTTTTTAEPVGPAFRFRINNSGELVGTFNITTDPNYGYNYAVNWTNLSDPNSNGSATGITGDYAIELDPFGTPNWEITITGTFPRFIAGPDASQITDIVEWGPNQWLSTANMFDGATNLGTISATDYPNLSQVSDMSYMFAGCTNFDADVSSWVPILVESTAHMFEGCEAFVGTGISNWQFGTLISGVPLEDASFMFAGAITFDANLSNWYVEGLINARSMFAGASAFTGQGLSAWVMTSLSDASFMFQNATSFDADLSNWSTQASNFAIFGLVNTVDMSYMFAGATSFQGQGLNEWTTTGSVQTMAHMFNGATSFDARLDLLNTSSVTDMSYMFANTTFTSAVLSGWSQTELVTNMSYMFAGNPSFNENLDSWSTLSLQNVAYMFSDSTWNNGESPGDIASVVWNTNTLITTEGMFKNNTGFNAEFNYQFSGSRFSAVTNMSYMFQGATAFTGSGANQWSTSLATNMESMFDGASAFNGDIGGWQTSLVTNMTAMFKNASSFNQNLSSWCVEQFLPAPTDFDLGTTLWTTQLWRPDWGTQCGVTTTSTSTTSTSTTSTTTSTTTTTTAPPPNSGDLLMYFDANNVSTPSGTWADQSGNSFNSTFESTNIQKFTANGGYLRLGNTANQIAIADQAMPNGLTGNNPRTVSVWFRLDVPAISTSYGIIGWGRTSSGLVNFDLLINPRANDDLIHIDLDSTLVKSNGAVSASKNAWTNVVFSWDGTTMKGYVNGTLQDQTNVSALSTQNNALRIGGGNQSTTASNFPGDFALVRVWNRTLSNSEITGEWNYYRGRFGL